MKMKSQLLEGLRNIKIRLVIKLKGLKDLLFQVDNLQKMIFAIIVMVKVTPGRYQNINKVEKSSSDTSDNITGNQDT